MRIITLSDTHTMHKGKWLNKFLKESIDPQQENVLIHSGDFSGNGAESQVADFIGWFQNLKGFDEKIFVAGNHDMSFERRPSWINHYINNENLSQSDCVYLQDEEYNYQSFDLNRSIKFYGSPWQPEFLNWGFNLPKNGNELKEKWDMIPSDTDILITHCPPHEICDYLNWENLGCKHLKNRVLSLNLLIHTFGHIHNGYGGKFINNTLFLNSSNCTEQYMLVNRPHIIDIKIENNILIAQKI